MQQQFDPSQEQDMQDTADQFKREMVEAVEVEGEADRGELIEILHELVGRSVGKAQLKSVLEAMPNAIASLLKKSSNNRVEIFGNIIVALEHRPESSGKTPKGKEYTEPQHYAVYTKMHRGALAHMETQYGLPCKNG